MPPRRAMAIAIRDSVTVSMALDTSGIATHDLAGQARGGVHLAGDDVGLARQQQHVVEGQAEGGERSRDVGRNAHPPILRPGAGLRRTAAAGTARRTRSRPVGQVLTGAVGLSGRGPGSGRMLGDHRSSRLRTFPVRPSEEPGRLGSAGRGTPANQLAHPAARPDLRRRHHWLKYLVCQGRWRISGIGSSTARAVVRTLTSSSIPRESAVRPGATGTAPPRRSASRARCSQQCREHALRVREPYGVWGAMTEDEREASYAAAS